MGTKYSTILVGGDVPNYKDDGTITDDGSQTEANRVKYATITTDLSNPLHVGIQNMDAKLVAHTNEGPDTEAGNVTLTTADHNKVLECTSTITVSLPNPSGNAGFQCTVKNAGSGTITVDVSGGANIDGGSSIALTAGEAAKVYVNNAGTAYYSVTGNNTAKFGEFASGTKMLFEQDTVTGWTRKTDAAYNNTGMQISTSTLTDSTFGSVNFDTVFGITATDGHTLTGAESGTSAHGHPAPTGNVLESYGGSGTAQPVIGAGTDTGSILNPEYDDQNANNHDWLQISAIANSTAASAASAHTHDIDLQLRYRQYGVFEKD